MPSHIKPLTDKQKADLKKHMDAYQGSDKKSHRMKMMQGLMKGMSIKKAHQSISSSTFVEKNKGKKKPKNPIGEDLLNAAVARFIEQGPNRGDLVVATRNPPRGATPAQVRTGRIEIIDDRGRAMDAWVYDTRDNQVVSGDLKNNLLKTAMQIGREEAGGGPPPAPPGGRGRGGRGGFRGREANDPAPSLGSLGGGGRGGRLRRM